MNRTEQLFERWIEHVAASIEMELRVEVALRAIRTHAIETEQPEDTNGDPKWQS